MRLASLLLGLVVFAGCQTTVSNAQILLERSGTGKATLPAFTAKGPYEVAYSFDHCGTATGMILIAHVRGLATPDTLLQSAAPVGSGNISGDHGGVVSLEVQTTCKWAVTVRG